MQVTRLSSFYDFQYGKGNNNPDNGGQYPVYGSNGIIGWYDKYNSEDAPVIGHIGANCGSVVWARGKHFVTYNGVICKIKAGCNPRYGYYLLLNSNLKSRFRGAAQPFISYDLLENVIVYNPPKAVQDKIASILSAYDNLIENNNKRIRLLEQMAENLYKEWFVRFRFPGHEKVEMENGLPKGWKVEKVQDWCRVFTGKKDVNQTVPNGKYAFFSCSPDTFKSNDYIYDGKAILVAGNGSYTGRTRYFEGKFDLYQRTYAVVSKNEDSEFLYYLYTRFKFDFEKIYSGGTRGSAIPYIVMRDLTRYRFLYEKNVVKKYTSIIRPLFRQIDILNEEIITLSRQRDLLLPRLMSGKLEVKE